MTDKNHTIIIQNTQNKKAIIWQYKNSSQKKVKYKTKGLKTKDITRFIVVIYLKTVTKITIIKSEMSEMLSNIIIQ